MIIKNKINLKYIVKKFESDVEDLQYVGRYNNVDKIFKIQLFRLVNNTSYIEVLFFNKKYTFNFGLFEKNLAELYVMQSKEEFSLSNIVGIGKRLNNVCVIIVEKECD